MGGKINRSAFRPPRERAVSAQCEAPGGAYRIDQALQAIVEPPVQGVDEEVGVHHVTGGQPLARIIHERSGVLALVCGEADQYP